MKIALVNPTPTASETGHAPHSGLAYLAGSLEGSGHECLHFDASLNTPDDLEALGAEGIGLIGITATSFTIADAVDLAGRLRTLLPKTPVVVGGPHISVDREKVLAANEVFDFAIIGEGEHTLGELVEALEAGGGHARFSGIKGLFFREGGRVVANEPRPWIEALDELPFPSFDRRMIHQYEEFPLITSRGCPYDCLYCASKVVWGRTWRPRSAENVVGEIAGAIEKYGWTGKPFCIVDDTFNLDMDRSRKFCDLVIEQAPAIRYVVYGFRADRVDEDLARSMKKSGCQVVGTGIESANPKVLENIHKAAKIDDIAKGIRVLRRAGIPVLGQFMIGNPGDSLDTIRESIAFAKSVDLDGVAFYLALPYPKTGLWDYVEANGRFFNRDFTRFHHYSEEPIFETPEFTREDRIKAYRMAQRFSHKRKMLFSVRRKVRALSRGEFSWSDLRAVARKGIRIITDIVTTRSKRW